MALLTDLDIKRLLNRDIVIDPFDPDSLTPVGYDFRVGSFVFSLEHGLLSPHDGRYEIPAWSTVQILTKESLWVSKRIGGSFHSKVSLASRGFAHIATTLDPNWSGPLLITTRNNTDKMMYLTEDQAFVTLLFFRVQTPTVTPHHKDPSRLAILLSQAGDLATSIRPTDLFDDLQEKQRAYITKVGGLLNNTPASQRFGELVAAANQSMPQKIRQAIRHSASFHLKRALMVCVVGAAIVAVGGAGTYWESLEILHRGIQYDSTIFAAQWMVVVALAGLLVPILGKR